MGPGTPRLSGVSIASKWLDLVVGLDLHLEMVPTPAPTPTPFPHPFVGLIFDPMGLVMDEVIAQVTAWATDTPPDPGKVLIAGLPATVTGDEVSMPVPHIFLPPGVAWAPVPRAPKPSVGLAGKLPLPDPPMPPPSDALLLMGSMTVKMMGSNAVRMGEIALSCSDPVRMPTSAVVSTGLPQMVTVGGPPGIDWQQVVMLAGMRALRTRWVSDKLHGLVDKVIPEKFARARNIAHKSACFVTGHPVNVATGSVLTDGVDFELPGPLPVRLERNYNSNWFDRPSPLGHGWAHNLDQKLWIEEHCIAYQTADGREIEFGTRDLDQGVMRKGDTLQDPVDRLTLCSHGRLRFTIEDHRGVVTEFAPIPGEATAQTDRGLARIVRQRRPDGVQVEYRYDAQARLAEVHDSGGRVVKLEHDAGGRLRRVWLPSADGEGHRQHVEYRYDDAGDLREVRNALGAAMRFEYDAHLLVSERDRNGLTFYFRYDGYGRYARCVETWGVDPASEEDVALHHHLIDYNRGGRQTTVTDSLGAVVTYRYDGAFMVIAVTDALGGETQYEYDHAHREVARVDPLGRRTETTYDARGNVVMIAAPGRRVTKIRYDAHDRPIARVDPEGAEWTWRYDGLGRTLVRVDPLGHATHYRYEGRRLQQVIDAAGRATTLSWDAGGGLATATAPDGTCTRWQRDALGRVTAYTDARGNVQRRTYDALGRVVRVQEPDGNQRELAYDDQGNVVRARDQRRDVSLGYCQLGKVATHTVGGHTIRYRYDTEGRLVGVTDPRGLEHRYDRDPRGEVQAEFGWDGRSTIYERDGLGRVTGVVNEGPGRATELAYDTAGELITVAYGEGPTHRYEYRKDGALLEAATDEVVVRFERDARGRVTKESVQAADGSDPHWVHSGLDHRGLRLAQRSSRGAEQDIVRDAMGDVTAIAYRDPQRSWNVAFGRDPVGLEIDRTVAGEASQTSPGGVRGYWWRDATGRPTQHWVGKASAAPGQSPTTHRLRKYGWKAGGRLQTLDDDHHGTTTYTHDARGFLHRADTVPTVGGDPVLDLRCPDDVGNLFRTLERSDREYTAAGQIVKRRGPQGTTTYRYDGRGNLSQRQDPEGATWYLHWDGAGQLRQVDRPDGTAVTYRYDALGRRVEKNAAGTITHWQWDGDVPLHEWRSSGEPPVAERTPELAARKQALLDLRERLQTDSDSEASPGSDSAPGDDRWLEIVRARAQTGTDAIAAEVLREASGEVTSPTEDADGLITWVFEPESFAPLARVSQHRGAHTIFTDHLGTPLCVADPAGSVAWSGVTDSYGDVSVHGDRSLCQWRFPGQYEDTETGLYYNRFRYYDPGSGNYISGDPLGLAGGLAIHGYVSDPLTWIDPLGLIGRASALAQGLDHANMPSISREAIPFSELNAGSRGRAWSEIQSDGASNLGWRQLDDQGNLVAEVFDHPDGHPLQAGPDFPEHHAHPHVHAVNAAGDRKVITYEHEPRKGGCK